MVPIRRYEKKIGKAAKIGEGITCSNDFTVPL